MQGLLGKLFLFNPWRSLTFLGALGLIGNYLVTSFDPAALTPTGQVVLNAISAVMTVTGLRNAIERSKDRPT